MPIVVVHQNSQQLGDLAQNAGNFATGQAQSADARGWQQLDNQYAESQQQHDLEAQHQVLQFTGQQRQQDFLNNFRTAQAALGQQQLASKNANFDANLQHQYDKDQGGYDQQAQNRDSRQQIAGDRNDLGYYKTDAGQELGYSKLNHQDAYHQQLLGVANQRLQDYEQRIASQATGGNAPASLALRQQIEQRVAGNQQVQQTRMYLQNLLAQETHLQAQMDPFKSPDLDDDTSNRIQHELAAVRGERQRVASIYKNQMLGASGTAVTGSASAPAPAPQMAPPPAPPQPAPGVPGQIAAGSDPGMAPAWGQSPYAAQMDPGAAPAWAHGPYAGQMDPGVSPPALQGSGALPPLAVSARSAATAMPQGYNPPRQPAPIFADPSNQAAYQQFLQHMPQPAPVTARNPQTGQRVMLDPATNQWVPIQ